MDYESLYEEIESPELEIHINVVSGFSHLKQVITNHSLFEKLRFYSVNHKFFNLVISGRAKHIVRFTKNCDIPLCFYLLALSETEDPQYKQSTFDEISGWCNPFLKKGLYWTEKILKELNNK